MVRVRGSIDATRMIDHTREMLLDFGKEYTLSRQTRSVNQFGELDGITSTNYTLQGDLQHSPFVDQRILEHGLIEKGDAVFYVEKTQDPAGVELQDLIFDGDYVWQVHSELEIGEFSGTSTFQAYRCTRYSDDS